MTTEHQIKTTVRLTLYYNAAQRWQYWQYWLKAVKDMKAPPTIIFATDSIAILCKIQSGYIPGEWFDLRDAHPTIKVIWVFVPGHSGVTCNETADMLASSCSDFTWLFPFWLKSDGNKVMERSAHHIHPILGRRTLPHIPWYVTWIITHQHQGRTCQNTPQPTAHWQHLLLHSFGVFWGACGRREDQCSSISSVNPLRQSKSAGPD